MSRKAIKILKAVQQTSAVNQLLRVAAHCRVSTKHEEQQQSLKTQINYYA